MNKFLFIFLVVCRFGYASDTLSISLKDLIFNCESEKSFLTNNQIYKDSILQQALQLECNENKYFYKIDAIYESLSQINKKAISKKYNKAKLIQEVYNAIHEKYLLIYNENVSLSSLFETGTYNCLTATILYVAAFEYIGISYQIKETPTHVYLIAEPNNLAITIETTTPTFGYIKYDDTYKKNYVNFLLENKFISQTEYNSSSIIDLFTKYYYKDETTDVSHLFSDLYYNKGILYQIESKYIDALNCFKKAYYLSKNSRLEYLINVNLLSSLYNETIQDKYQVSSFISLAKMSNIKATGIYLKYHFEQFTNDVLEKANNLEKYISTFNNFISYVNDTSLKQDLTYMYYANISDHYSYKENYLLSLENSINALKLYPQNARIVANIDQLLRNEFNRTFNIDLPEAYDSSFKKIITLIDEVPTVYNSTKIANTLIESLGYYVSDIYDSNTIPSEFLNVLEKRLGSNPSNEKKMTSLYIEYYLYCCMEKNHKEARKIINKGLQLFPKNADLLEKSKLLKENGF